MVYANDIRQHNIIIITKSSNNNRVEICQRSTAGRVAVHQRGIGCDIVLPTCQSEFLSPEIYKAKRERNVILAQLHTISTLMLSIVNIFNKDKCGLCFQFFFTR